MKNVGLRSDAVAIDHAKDLEKCNQEQGNVSGEVVEQGKNVVASSVGKAERNQTANSTHAS